MRSVPCRTKAGCNQLTVAVEAIERRLLMSVGMLNTAFGGSGYVSTSATNLSADYNNGPSGGVAAFSDGSVVLAGTKLVSSGSVTSEVYRPDLVKLNSNGSVDTSFGTDGEATHVLMDGTDAVGVLVSQVLVAPGNKILIIGSAFNLPNDGANNRYVVERFNADGSFDTTFNPLPLLNYFFGKSGPNEIDTATSAAIQPDGKIVVVGSSGNGNKFNLGVVRLNTDGSIDTTFGFQNSGSRLVLGEGDVSASVVIDSAGRIVVGGEAIPDFAELPITGGQLEVERLTPTGGIDTAFGNDGLAISNIFAGQVYGYGVGVQPDGTIVVAGTDAVYSLTQPNISPIYDVTAAFTSTGAIKSSYGSSGIFQSAPSDSSSFGYAMQTDGKSLIISTRLIPNVNPNLDELELQLVRVTTAGQLDTTFGTAGVDSLQLPDAYHEQPAAMVFAPDAAGGKIDVMLFNPGNPITLAGAQLTDDVSIPAPPTKLSGTVIGTTGSYRNQGNTAVNAFDGNLQTFFDAPTASGSFVGLDLGSPKVVTQISYAPRSGFASRMVGGVFQASNSANFSTGVTTLYTITAVPVTGSLTTITIANTTAFRYVRYLGPANSYGNIAELIFAG